MIESNIYPSISNEDIISFINFFAQDSIFNSNFQSSSIIKFHDIKFTENSIFKTLSFNIKESSMRNLFFDVQYQGNLNCFKNTFIFQGEFSRHKSLGFIISHRINNSLML